MKIAIISDVHANLEALEAVLEDIENQKIETVFCLGDVVGYGPDPNACMALVEKTCEIKLMGNHDFYALGTSSNEHFNPIAKESHDWTQKQLSDYEISQIENYKMDHVHNGIYLVHSSPFEPDQWNYILSPQDAQEGFEKLEYNLCFVGHTHLPTIFVARPNDLPRMKIGHNFTIDSEEKYIVNIGSVGQPRDNDPLACYVTYDSELGDINYRRIEYDIAKAQKKMAAAKLPEMLIKRIAIGR